MEFQAAEGRRAVVDHVVMTSRGKRADKLPAPVILPQPAPKGLTRLLKRPVVPEPVSMAGMRPIFNVPQSLGFNTKAGFALEGFAFDVFSAVIGQEACSK